MVNVYTYSQSIFLQIRVFWLKFYWVCSKGTNERHINGLEQDCAVSANALEILQSCTKPLIYPNHFDGLAKDWLTHCGYSSLALSHEYRESVTCRSDRLIYTWGSWPSQGMRLCWVHSDTVFPECWFNCQSCQVRILKLKANSETANWIFTINWITNIICWWQGWLTTWLLNQAFKTQGPYPS